MPCSPIWRAFAGCGDSSKRSSLQTVADGQLALDLIVNVHGKSDLQLLTVQVRQVGGGEDDLQLDLVPLAVDGMGFDGRKSVTVTVDNGTMQSNFSMTQTVIHPQTPGAPVHASFAVRANPKQVSPCFGGRLIVRHSASGGFRSPAPEAIHLIWFAGPLVLHAPGLEERRKDPS